MAIKVNARETELKIGKNPGYYYVMTPDLYLALKTSKVIKEAALRSGVSQGVMQASGMQPAKLSRHGLLKVTLWHCQDSELCVSHSVQRLWLTLTT